MSPEEKNNFLHDFQRWLKCNPNFQIDDYPANLEEVKTLMEQNFNLGAKFLKDLSSANNEDLFNEYSNISPDERDRRLIEMLHIDPSVLTNMAAIDPEIAQMNKDLSPVQNTDWPPKPKPKDPNNPLG